MTLDELRQLNLNNIANWPLAAKAGALALVFILLLLAALFLDWKGQWDSLKSAQAEEQTLKNTFLDKKRMAINLEPYKRQLEEINREFGALLRQLPNKSEMEGLITDINQAGLGRGLQFELFKPNVLENMTEFYAELPVTLKVTGNYHDLGSFASDVGKLSRIVLLSDLNVTSEKDGQLAMEAVAKTFRYLDDEEVAAALKLKKEKEQKEKKK